MAGENGGLISGGYNPLEAPDAPTSVSGSAGDESIDVSFTAPSDVGGAAIQTYIAVATASGETTAGEGASSPVTISGLTNGTAYSISAYAKNTYGYSPAGLGAGTVSPVAPPAIGLFAMGIAGGVNSNVIEQITVSTLGNATDFGDMSYVGRAPSCCGSKTRGVIAAGDQSRTNVIDKTRGLFLGGFLAGGGEVNTIQYITIASTGNAQDFGDLTEQVGRSSGCSSPTRTIRAGAELSSGVSDVIDFVTTATLGNATDFGDLTVARRELSAGSNSTRGLFFGGRNSSSVRINTIDYITLASASNATDFGDLSVVSDFSASVTDATRCVTHIGFSGAATNILEYVTIASTGNASNFGDLTATKYFAGGCSSGNGGVQ